MQTVQMDQETQHCLQLCKECHAQCEQMILYCLQRGGPHAALDHQRLLRDCAQICQTSVDFMLRQSPLSPSVCATCAEVCLRCAESCERVAPGDAHMQACADLCRRCLQACEQMAQART